MLRAEKLSFKVDSKQLLKQTEVEFPSEKFHVIMGANGAGKSTLLKLLAGDLKPSSGKIQLLEKDLNQYSKKDLALKRAVLSQHYNISFPIIVKDIVMMGRYPHFTNIPSADDLSICNAAMEKMQVNEFAERDYNTLSGGESQKVQMSRVLAQIWDKNDQEQKILFLDEPVSHLDIKYQHQLLQAAKELCKKNITIIAILHDINLALAYADRLLFMKQGELIFDINQPYEVTIEMIQEVFDVSSKIIYPDAGKPVVIF